MARYEAVRRGFSLMVPSSLSFYIIIFNITQSIGVVREHPVVDKSPPPSVSQQPSHQYQHETVGVPYIRQKSRYDEYANREGSIHLNAMLQAQNDLRYHGSTVEKMSPVVTQVSPMISL